MVNAKGEWVHKMINILIRGGFYFSFQKGGIVPVFCIGVNFWRFYIPPLHIWPIPSSSKYFKLMRVSDIQFSSLSSHPHHRYCFIHSTQSSNFSQYPPRPRFQRLITSFLDRSTSDTCTYFGLVFCLHILYIQRLCQALLSLLLFSFGLTWGRSSMISSQCWFFTSTHTNQWRPSSTWTVRWVGRQMHS